MIFRRPLLLLLMAVPGLSHAAVYTADLSTVMEREDLRELYTQGELTEEELEALEQLFDDPVALNRADAETLSTLPEITLELGRAIVAHREKEGPFERLDDLLEVQGISDEVLAQLRPFVEVELPLLDRHKVVGSISTRAIYAFGDQVRAEAIQAGESSTATQEDVLRAVGYTPLPESYVRVRARSGKDWSAGVVVLEEEDIAAYSYDPADMDFAIDRWGHPTVRPEKLYLEIHQDTWSAIAGTYSVGFGQGVTFDNTGRAKPKGFYRDDLVGADDDLSSPEKMLGAAVTFKNTRVGPTWIAGTAFASFQRYNLYENDFQLPSPVDPATAVSPQAEIAPGVDLPYVTYPNLYSEGILGGRVQFTPGVDRNHLGLMAWGASVNSPLELNFTGKMPDRAFFGAIGTDFSAGLGGWDLRGEAALMDTGAPAIYVRNSYTWRHGEVGAALRYYDRYYDNPHSSAPAGSDTYSVSTEDQVLDEQGALVLASDDRDRDETGVRLDGQYSYAKKLYIRGHYDQWRNPSTKVWDLTSDVRVDYRVKRKLGLAGQIGYANKDLSANDHGRSYESVVAERDPETGEILTGSEEFTQAQGSRLKLGAQVSSDHLRELHVRLAYARIYQDDARIYYEEPSVASYGFRVGQQVGLQAWLELPEDVRAILRLRYTDDDVYGSAGERIFGASVQGTWSPEGQSWRLGMRYALEADLYDPPDPVLATYENDGVAPEPSAFPEGSPTRTPEQAVTLSFEIKF